MDSKALYSLSYGLYLLSVKDENGDNACIINTAVQIGSDPCRISVSVIRENYTAEILQKTKEFTISTISEEADFALFQRFGMQSGREHNKFEGFEDVKRAENGLFYLTKAANAFLSVRVDSVQDLGSHLLFIGTVTEGEVLSEAPSATYAFYHKNIKPKSVAKGWKCRICGYVYQGEELPQDFLCPLCNHGAEDFEKEDGKQEENEEEKYVCSVCGYVHTGDAPPEKCPICSVGADKFKKVN